MTPEPLPSEKLAIQSRGDRSHHHPDIDEGSRPMDLLVGGPFVLVVEDDVSLQRALGGLLRRRGFAPVEAATVATAIRQAKEHSLTAVILDLLLELPSSSRARTPRSRAVRLRRTAVSTSRQGWRRTWCGSTRRLRPVRSAAGAPSALPSPEETEAAACQATTVSGFTRTSPPASRSRETSPE
jgi:hypothetical protein